MDSVVGLNVRLKKLINSRKKPMNQTKNMIYKMKSQAPVLSTIADYSGKSTVGQILKPDNEQDNSLFDSQFQKILKNSNNIDSQSEHQTKKAISFIQYKSSPHKHRLQTNPLAITRKKSVKNTIVVEMPTQLKLLKNQMLSLPKIWNRRQKTQGNQLSINTQSNCLQNQIEGTLCQSGMIPNKFQKRRMKTQITQAHSLQKIQYHTVKQKKNRNSYQFYKQIGSDRRRYSASIKEIIREFDSLEKDNSKQYIMDRYKQCKNLLLKKDQLKHDYEKFEKLGQPHQKIIILKKSADNLEKSVDNRLDKQLANQILKMDSKRYDLIIKHEEQKRKMNLLKFRQQQRSQKIQLCKSSLLESKNQRNAHNTFKLNVKGKEVYAHKKGK